MSPTSKELVANRPLRGDELSKIIQADVAEILSRDCMLTTRVAYGRVSYTVRVVLHMDNPSFPESTSVLQSQRRSDNEVELAPELAAIEGPPPLKGATEESYVSAQERTREIDSPNVARIENGLPITVLRPGFDTGGNATTVEEQVTYPSEVVEEVSKPPVDADLTRMVKGAFADGSNLL